MKTFHKSLIMLFVFFFFLLGITACDTVQKTTNDLLNLVGFGSDTKTDQTTKKTKSKEKTKQPKKGSDNKTKAKTEDAPDADISPPTENKGKIIVTKEDKILDEQDADSREKTKTDKTTFSPQAPVNVLFRIGGSPQKVMADNSFVYVNFPQDLVLYDAQFKVQARKPLIYPVQDVRLAKRENSQFLYVKEAGNTLDIFEIIPSTNDNTTPFVLKSIKAFNVDGDFYWLDDKTLLIFLASKIQVLDFSDLFNIKIINEAPIGGVTDAYLAGRHLYLARQNFLDIFSLDNHDVISSLRIGSDFSFLTLTTSAEHPQLIIGLKTPQGALHSIQEINLNPDFSNVTDFGTKTPLAVKMSDFTYDHDNQILIGKELNDDGKGPVQLYHLKYKKYLRGPLSQDPSLSSWYFSDHKLYTTNQNGVSINTVTLDPKVIAQSGSLQQITQNTATVPLAQIGATKLLRDEYSLNTLAQWSHSVSAKQIALLDQNRLAIIEDIKNSQKQKLLTTNNLTQEDFSLSEPSISQQTSFDYHLVTPFGVFLYSQETQKIYLLDVDLKQTTTLPFSVPVLFSWNQFNINAQDILAIATKGNNSYEVSFYELKAPDDLPLIRTLSYTEKPFVFYVPQNQIVILTKKQLDLYRWGDIVAGETQTSGDEDPYALEKPKTGLYPIETVPLKDFSHDIISAKISPVFDRVYALLKKDDQYTILVFNIFNFDEHAVLSDFDITRDHFENLSFSKKGRVFILPTAEGTLFYDMTQLDKVKELAHWPDPSYAIDIAQQGQFICAALGHKGVACGELKF